MKKFVLKAGAWTAVVGLVVFLLGAAYSIFTTPTETSPAMFGSSVKHYTSQSSPRP